MDQTKVATVGITAFVGVILVVLGYTFVANHWEDIKTLFIIAIVAGGTFSLALGGLKLRAGR